MDGIIHGIDGTFIAGKLMNLANRRGHWTQGAEYKRTWRQKVVLAFRHSGWQQHPAKKRISIMANVWGLYDAHDGLRNACKPIVDGLIDAGVIDGDGPSCGHEFHYSQGIRRDCLGVTIKVEAL